MSERLLKKVLGSKITRGTLEVIGHKGDSETFGTPTEGYPDVTVRFADRKTARDILLDPRLGAGECFMDGRLIVEKGGGIMEMIQLIRANTPWESGQRLQAPSVLKRVRNRLSFLARSFNRPASAKRNIAHHYDIGNDLYALFLDKEHWQYSCAYWPGYPEDRSMSLDEAQERKLAHIAAKLDLKPGMRVVEIGCGWGGLAIYLARKFDVHVTGITLSEEQAKLAVERAEAAGVADKVDIKLIDYRAFAESGGKFDRVVSIAMFEAVGRPQFETYFRCCGNLMKQNGVFLVHTIGRMGGPGSTDAFTSKYIFPGGYIPALSETLAASEKFRLIASDIETLRLHYAPTLRAWYDRCMADKDAIVAMYDERFFRMWTFYLAGATAAFESGGMCNYQIQYVRDRHALPITRDYMAEGERQLLA
ncbi:SAM-dependent methyltransferase [Erythrobacter litoralis]|uniref:Cyclopropane fatty acid synthase n=1 Tax=Erythrobacter litoralis (strain HTCC2594) TaxID=314225 RepID=Q2N9I0_ERYLH|nr:cyclopropane-fatty-acyl-phospholipid synthase family protein [Erythrobacter litoralis]ABC63661.1 cyclopropane fatty acid synthase [Erythrobacter litoralis HTCC2594]